MGLGVRLVGFIGDGKGYVMFAIIVFGGGKRREGHMSGGEQMTGVPDRQRTRCAD